MDKRRINGRRGPCQRANPKCIDLQRRDWILLRGVDGVVRGAIDNDVRRFGGGSSQNARVIGDIEISVAERDHITVRPEFADHRRPESPARAHDENLHGAVWVVAGRSQPRDQ